VKLFVYGRANPNERSLAVDEEQKKQIAVFRFGVIADFVTGPRLPRSERQRLLTQKCVRKWTIPFSHRTRIGKSTVRDWIARYQAGGQKLEALYPKDRCDSGKSRSIDEETAANLIQLRKQMPTAPVAVLIETMCRRQLVEPGTVLAPTSVWRFFTRHGLMPSAQSPAVDRRKFEAELPNDIWQSDVMHGPPVVVNGRRRKTYLIAFIDDHSRLVPHAAFYLSENLDAFLNAFEQALLKRGLPRKLYVDNGSAYRSRHLEHICAQLSIAMIHAKAYQPQGKGKIERFFRTVRMQFLPTLTTDMILKALNAAWTPWLDGYHQRRHSATGATPWQRFADRMQCLRPAPDDLKDHFRIVARRRVAKDRSVTLDGRLYEAPVALIGKRIDLLYHKNNVGRIEARFNNQSYGFLRPVDLAVNCRVKRDRNRNTQIEPTKRPAPKGGKIW
jgi:transposase InsO family protein